MKTFNYKPLAVALGTTLLLTGALSVYAADYSGSFNGTVGSQTAQPVSGDGERVMVLGTSSGTNKSTGNNAYFDGGSVSIVDSIDMVNGNGTYSGYITFSQDGETHTHKMEGNIITVMAPDGKTPMTTIEGTFDNTSGTNLYATLHPYGTFKSTFVSQTEYTSEWVVTRFK